MRAAAFVICGACLDSGWVCEAHVTHPWAAVAGGDECCKGAGRPCPACNKGEVPFMPPGGKIIWINAQELDADGVAPEGSTFVPCIAEQDGQWIVVNYLDAEDIRYTGSFTECEQWIRDNA